MNDLCELVSGFEMISAKKDTKGRTTSDAYFIARKVPSGLYHKVDPDLYEPCDGVDFMDSPMYRLKRNGDVK